MSKPKKGKPEAAPNGARSEPEEVVLTFDLFDLPTTQHKAGLAGLLLQIQSMKDRRFAPEKVPVVEELTRTAARIRFTKESVQALFDDLYDAKTVKISSTKKWPGASPIEETINEEADPETGKIKQVRRFVYEVVQPQAPCLDRYLGSVADDPWLKLWRDMVWAIPRGINTTRAPFKQRSEARPCSDGAVTWKSLLELQKALEGSAFATSPISSALMLAAQAENAEGARFLGRNDHNLLLHFWQIVVVTYLPYLMGDDGSMASVGFTLSIPDVADLREFLVAFPEFLGALPRDRHKRTFRPDAAVVDAPVQSSLEFLRHLHDLAAGKASRESWHDCVSAVESFHMSKAGNNVKLLAFDRVANRPDLVSKYERIKKSFRNSMFRAAVLRNLLRDQPWYGEMLDLFAERPWPLFVEHEKTPRYIPRFGADARAQFRAIQEDVEDMNDDESTVTERLSPIVWRLVDKFVEGRAEAKTGLKAKNFPKVAGADYRNYPKEFREAQQKVCTDAFLAMRSRHDRDFVEYFAGSICSVMQYLPVEDYQFLTAILMRPSQKNAVGKTLPCWEDVKALAMIAASARSYAVRPRDPQPQPEGDALPEPENEEV